MSIGKASFKNEKEITNFIFECEEKFESMLSHAADEIILKNVRIITICGPTCSGKTTTAGILTSKLKAKGKNVHILSFDDFYLDRDTIIKNCLARGAEVEYESASTLDLPLLKKVMGEIASEDKTTVPRFDFNTGARAGYKEYVLCDDDVFIFEGIQAFYEEVFALYSHLEHYSIYISVKEPISFGENVFDTETIRFLRRVVRDKKHRQTTAEETSKMWKTVRENEEANIFPNIHRADFIIDSSLAYEINVIQGDAREALGEVDPKSSFYKRAMELLSKFNGISQIDEDYVPTESVLQEFIN